MSKYLITGVCGFVGKHFVDCLRHHEPDSDVLGVDIVETTQIPNIRYQQMDLTDKASVYQVLSEEKPDVVVHLAAMSSVAQSWQNPAWCFTNNMMAFLNLAESIRELNIKTRLLCIGSSEEYGLYDKPMAEDLALQPQNPYAVTKVSQEYLSQLYVDRFGMDIVMTRSFNHIGPGQSTRFFVPSMIKQLIDISKGRQENSLTVGNIDVIRDFLDVRDVVNAYYLIIKKGKSREVYNVCSGAGVKLRDIIEMAGTALNIAPNIKIDPERIRPNEILSIVGNNTKLCKELGWQMHYSLQQTISDTIKDMENKYVQKD